MDKQVNNTAFELDDMIYNLITRLAVSEAESIRETRILESMVKTGLREAEIKFANRYRGLGAEKLEEVGEMINILKKLPYTSREIIDKFLDKYLALCVDNILNN